jgi:hypothetical protein
MSLESTEEGHCSKFVIEGLVYLKYTGGDLIAERSKDEYWQPAGLVRQE